MFRKENSNIRPVDSINRYYCTQIQCLASLLGLSLSSDSLHGFAHSLLISQELHWLHGLQILVKLVEDGDARWQVQLHDGLV